MTEKRKRSKLEERLAKTLDDLGIAYQYEVTKIGYKIPESQHTYTVDWTLKNGTLIESKGYLSDHAERQKYILIKKQRPDVDLRFVFADPNKRCGGMKTTHAQWANKNGFVWCSVNDIDVLKKWAEE